MKRSDTFLLAVTLVALVGCIPEKRVIWSHDGKHAAVIGADGLYLCDAAGKLSARVAQKVKRAAWFPDSRRLLAMVESEAKTWDDVAPLIPESRRKELIARAEQVRAEALAFQGDWDQFKPGAFNDLTPGEAAAAVLYVRDGHHEGLLEKLGAKWEDMKNWAVTVHSFEAFAVTDLTAKRERTLLKLIDDVGELRISPDGRAVAFVTPMAAETGDARLSVASTERTDVAYMVADLVALFPDWSADGRYLVFARGNVPGGGEHAALRLGSVMRRQVRGDDGAILNAFPESESMAGILFHEQTKVRCLRDGRILFTSADVHLPATTRELPEAPSLFALDPTRHSTVVRMTPHGVERELADGLVFLEVSPDGEQASIPASDGTVAILTLATGELVRVQEQPSEETKMAMVPTWRGDDELTFVVPKGSPLGSSERAEVVIWSPAGTRCISKDWPAHVVEGFLTPQPKEQPTSQAAE